MNGHYNYYLVCYFAHNKLQRLLIALFILSTLTSCSVNDMNDLKKHVEEVKKRPPSYVEPLPEIQPYETFAYKATDLRDPFQQITDEKDKQPISSDLIVKPKSNIRPDFNRNREALENYQLDSLKMVGIIERENERWGLIRSPDGTIHRVQVGNFIGKNHGKINQIYEDLIKLTEIIPDGSDGWQERTAELALSE